MRIAHILRKYDPAEWGGTETALLRLLGELRVRGTDAVVYCPRLAKPPESDPLAASGATVKRFDAFLPVWGLPEERRRQLVAVGGNLLSFNLAGTLKHEPGINLIHTHTLGRLGGIALTTAARRRIPLVVTIHGGVLDLPDALKQSLNGPTARGLEWGRLFGWFYRSRRLLERADVIVTCNPREAELLRERYPLRRVVVHPHGVPSADYAVDQRSSVRDLLPREQGCQWILCLGRIDPAKNQGWLVEQAPEFLRRHPRARLVLAGACTDEAYGSALRRRLETLGIASRVVLAGGLPAGGDQLIGLLQASSAVVVPSISETFGLVILEAWAAGTPVISSRTSGAASLIRHGRDGWLFDLDRPGDFHAVLARTLEQADVSSQLAAAGRRKVVADFDCAELAGRMRGIYERLIAENGNPAPRPHPAPMEVAA